NQEMNPVHSSSLTHSARDCSLIAINTFCNSRHHPTLHRSCLGKGGGRGGEIKTDEER
ncbi:mCG146302, partial [Mus musculus]